MEVHYQRLEGLVMKFLHSLFSFGRLSLNLLFLLLFFLTLLFFNFLKKCFHIFMVTKVMLSNPLFIQGGELLGVPYKKFIKEYRFDRIKILKINSKELSKFGDDTSNENGPN